MEAETFITLGGIIITLAIIVGLPIITTIKQVPVVDCLGEYAKDYCDNKSLRLTSYNINSFYCGEDERTTETIKYNYLPIEKEICNGVKE